MNPQPVDDTVEYVPPKAPKAEWPPRPESVRVDIAPLTHTGLIRAENQDHYLVIRAGRFLQTVATSLPAGAVPDEYGVTLHGMALADGMGGMAGGEVASRMALARLLQLVIDTPDWIVPRDESHFDEVQRRTDERFREVNATVAAHANREPRLHGMGTTLTLAWSLGADLHVAHVGDSRAYLSRRGMLHLLTRDHSLSQQLADLGMLPFEEVSNHRLRHVLTQFIGGQESQSVPEIERYTLADGDRLLLCTDGLFDGVDDATIGAVLSGDATSTAMAESLVDLAIRSGGRDNVTVIVARYEIS